MEDINNFSGQISGRAKITNTQTFAFRSYANILGHQKGIDGCGEKGEKIVLTGIGVVELAPQIKAVEISAEGQNNRCILHHWLVEMTTGQQLLHLCITIYNDTINLHVAGSGSPAPGFKNFVQLFIWNINCLVFPDGTVLH